MEEAEGERPVSFIRSAPDSLALACISAAVLCYQVILMQLLAAVVWYHFAYLVISFALLGFGLSGTLLTVRALGRRLAERSALSTLAAFSATSMLGVVALAGAGPFQIDLYGIFSDSATWTGPIAIQGLLLLPFTSGALVIATILLRTPSRAGINYGINLSASALGALITPALLNFLTPIQALIVPASLAAIGSLVTLGQAGRSARIRTCAILLLGVFLTVRPFPLPVSPYKDISRMMSLPEATILETAPSAHGVYQRLRSPALRLSTPLDLNYPGTLPPVEAVLVNGDAILSLVRTDSEIGSLWSHTPEGVLEKLVEPGPVWILEPETTLAGSAWSKTEGADVTLVFRHPRLVGLPDRFIGNANLVLSEPRAYLESATGRAALIRFPSPGSPSGSVGLGALSEQPLFTSEAIATAWSLLKDGGILIATVPIDHPMRSAPRLLNTMQAGIARAGESETSNLLLGLRTWSTLTLLARRGGFSPGDLATAESFAALHGFDLMAAEPILQKSPAPFHSFADPTDLDRLQRLFDQPSSDRAQGGLFRLGPPSDDCPYFSQFIRIRQIPRLLSTVDLRSLAYLELGLPIVLISLVQLFLLGSILIAIPWIGRHAPRAPARVTASAFGCAAGLGLGFILAEIGLIHRAVFFTGNPILAASAILATILLAAGAGSWFGQRRVHVGFGPAGPAVILAVFFTAMAPLAARWILPTPFLNLVVFASAASVAGFIMGMPFPRLIAQLGGAHRALLPWTWAVNGFLSVIGAPVAALLSVTHGTLALFLTAAFAYGLAGVSGCILTRQTRAR
ncbi:MAG: hypothetical protein R3F07_02250 [Opitutaceae bacterium]